MDNKNNSMCNGNGKCLSELGNPSSVKISCPHKCKPTPCRGCQYSFPEWCFSVWPKSDRKDLCHNCKKHSIETAQYMSNMETSSCEICKIKNFSKFLRKCNRCQINVCTFCHNHGKSYYVYSNITFK